MSLTARPPRKQGAATRGEAFHAPRAVLATLALLAMFWSVSSWGYYALVEALAVESGYDDAPILFAGYYLGWSMVALLAFRHVFAGQLSRPILFGHVVALAPILLRMEHLFHSPSHSCRTFQFFAHRPTRWSSCLPLPGTTCPNRSTSCSSRSLWRRWFYARTEARVPLRAICILMAVMFGGFHLTLALDGFSPLYVARFTVAASIFGLVTPWLYLRTRYGFRWAYGLHWGFYALDAVITHLVLAVPKWAM